MAYGKVHDAYWDSDRIESLSDRAALLGLYLLTGEHRNAIGCFKLGTGAITDVPRFKVWGYDGVSDTLSELVGIGFIERDNRTGWTLIVKHLKHDPIKGSKVGTHALLLVKRVPVNIPLYATLKKMLEPQLSTAFETDIGRGKEFPGYPMREPEEAPPERVCDTPSVPHAIPNRSPEPYPEPEPSDANVSGAIAPENPKLPLCLVRPPGDNWKHALYNQGLDWLGAEAGKPPDKMRSLIGRWLRFANDDAKRVFDTMAEAQAGNKAEPVAWINTKLGGRHGTGTRNQPASVLAAIGRK